VFKKNKPASARQANRPRPANIPVFTYHAIKSARCQQHFIRHPADIGQASAALGIAGGAVADPGPGRCRDPFENGRTAVSGGILPDILPGVAQAVTDQFFCLRHNSLLYNQIEEIAG